MTFVADVFDVTLIDPVTKEAFASTTLTEANIEFTLESSDIRGGRGNSLLGVLHSDRDIVINLTDVSFNYEWIARQMGSDIITGESEAIAMPKFYTVEEDAGSPIITLENAPILNDELGVLIYTVDGEKIEGAVVTGNEVDFTSATPTVKVDDDVEVRAYRYATDSKTETIEFDVAKYPKGAAVVLETIEIDGDERITHKIQYQFDSASPDGNFTINTASAREAQTMEMVLRVLKPKHSTKVGKALRIPYTGE